ncbi:hypothetical protein EV121DRAFT_297046 [Schizophyllum commune]
MVAHLSLGLEERLLAADPKELCRSCGHAYYLHWAEVAELSRISDAAFRKGGIPTVCATFVWIPLVSPTLAFNTACAGCGNPLRGHGGLPQDMLALLDGLATSPAAPPSTAPPRIPAPSPSVSGPITSIPQPAGIPGRVSSLWQAPSRVSSSGSAPQQRRAGAQRAYHSHSLQPPSSSSARPPPRGKAKAAEITIVILVWPVPLLGRFASGEHCLADISLDLYQFFALYRRLQDHQLVFDVAVPTNQEGNALAHTLAMQIRTHLTSSGYSIIDNPNGDTDKASDLYIASLPFEPVRAKKSRNSARFETTKYGPNTFDVKAIKKLAGPLSSPAPEDNGKLLLIIAPKFGLLAAPLSKLRPGIDHTLPSSIASGPHPCFSYRVLKGLSYGLDGDDKFPGHSCVSREPRCPRNAMLPSIPSTGSLRRQRSSTLEHTGLSPARTRIRRAPPSAPAPAVPSVSTVGLSSSRSLFSNAAPPPGAAVLEISSDEDEFPPVERIMDAVAQSRPRSHNGAASVSAPDATMPSIPQPALPAPHASTPASSAGPSANTTHPDGESLIRSWQRDVRGLISPLTDSTEQLWIYAPSVGALADAYYIYLDWVVRKRFGWMRDRPFVPDAGHRMRRTMSVLAYLQPAAERSAGLQKSVDHSGAGSSFTPGAGVEREALETLLHRLSAMPAHWTPSPVQGSRSGVTLTISGSASGASEARQHEARVHGTVVALHCLNYGNAGPVSLWAVLALAMGKASMMLPAEFYAEHAPEEHALMKGFLALSPDDPIIPLPLDGPEAQRARADPSSVYSLITMRLGENIAVIGNTNRDPEDHHQLKVRLWSVLLLANADPWEHILFKQAREGFNLHLETSSDGTRLLDTLRVAHVSSLVAAMCNRTITNVSQQIVSRLRVDSVTRHGMSADDEALITLGARLFKKRLIRYLLGKGHTTLGGGRGLSDVILRARNLLRACHGSIFRPVEADWQIKVEAYLIPDSEDFTASIAFHSCFSSLDVSITGKLIEMMSDPNQRWDDHGVSTEFDEWLHDQILSVLGLYNIV